MNIPLNEKLIRIVCLMFKLTEKQLDLLEGPFMIIARPILTIAGLLVVAYWLLTDIGIPAVLRAARK